jgi:hypothetical protein
MRCDQRDKHRPGSEQFLGNAGDMQMKAANTLFEHVGPIAGFVVFRR